MVDRPVDATQIEMTCKNCGDRIRTFLRPGESRPTVCGRFACRVTEWTLAEWEGRARMAAAREAAGIELDAIDRQALRRCRPMT